MSFHTPHGTRAPPAAVELDVVRLPDAVRGAVGAVRRPLRGGEGRARASGEHRRTPTAGRCAAPLIVDALGWRRVLGPGANVQPPEARISRGLEVHPEGGGVDLDVWIDRSLIRRGYAWSVPGGRRAARRRRLLRAARPRQGADARDRRAGRRAAGPLPGQLVPAPAAPGGRGRRVLRRRLAPATASRSRARASAPRSTSASPAAASCAACSAGSRTREQALAAYGAFSRRHARAFAWALALQRLIPALPPRLLARLLALVGPAPGERPRLRLVPAPGRPGLRAADAERRGGAAGDARACSGRARGGRGAAMAARRAHAAGARRVRPPRVSAPRRGAGADEADPAGDRGCAATAASASRPCSGRAASRPGGPAGPSRRSRRAGPPVAARARRAGARRALRAARRRCRSARPPCSADPPDRASASRSARRPRWARSGSRPCTSRSPGTPSPQVSRLISMSSTSPLKPHGDRERRVASSCRA